MLWTDLFLKWLSSSNTNSSTLLLSSTNFQSNLFCPYPSQFSIRIRYHPPLSKTNSCILPVYCSPALYSISYPPPPFFQILFLSYMEVEDWEGLHSELQRFLCHQVIFFVSGTKILHPLQCVRVPTTGLPRKSLVTRICCITAVSSYILLAPTSHLKLFHFKLSVSTNSNWSTQK